MFVFVINLFVFKFLMLVGRNNIILREYILLVYIVTVLIPWDIVNEEFPELDWLVLYTRVELIHDVNFQVEMIDVLSLLFRMLLHKEIVYSRTFVSSYSYTWLHSMVPNKQL